MSQEANPSTAENQATKKRRGIVLVAVLVVVASLSLAGYHYATMMTSEYKGSENAHRMVQAKCLTESGVHYAAACLSNPDNFASILNHNPFNNPHAFRDVPIQGSDGKLMGRFSIIAPPDMDNGGGGNGPLYGAVCESGKINLNALMKIDPTGNLAVQMLLKLPNMTEEIANCIVDWMDPDNEPRTGGAENDYYMAQNPPYRCKNGPIESIAELLLVKGVTAPLLYGSDANRNGFDDGNEGGVNGFDRGWAAYLTVHSREINRDPAGNALLYLNDTSDLSKLYDSLANTDISDEMAKFIILYLQNKDYSPSTGGTQGLNASISALFGSTSSQNPNNTIEEADLSSYQLDFSKKTINNKTIPSYFTLVNAQVAFQKVVNRKTVTTVFSSPLRNDVGKQRDLLPKLFGQTTLIQDANSDLPAAINVNTAPAVVLAGLPGFTDNDVQKIIGTRPSLSSTEAMADIYSTPAWLLTEAQLDPNLLVTLCGGAQNRLITTRSQVYRVQVVGYPEGKGPVARVEAVIDTNVGRPRILNYRDLTELGKGLPAQ